MTTAIDIANTAVQWFEIARTKNNSDATEEALSVMAVESVYLMKKNGEDVNQLFLDIRNIFVMHAGDILGDHKHGMTNDQIRRLWATYKTFKDAESLADVPNNFFS